MTVLITGGAGYIGSHMALSLIDRGEKVCVLDNISTGVRELVPDSAKFFQGDISDRSLVQWILIDQGIDAVLHFAGSTVVPESVTDPLLYYRNNTAASRDLLETCIAAGVKHFIFSSTAAVYGATEAEAVGEDAPTRPISPYGRSKLMTEWMLEDVAQASALTYVCLRYFNVAGADPDGRAGQATPKATHLIKRACQAAIGEAPALGVFGVDYPTFDGTGVRDYIHVSDLTAAHALALDHLRAGGESGTFNCGYGRGFSVREVIGAVERACGRTLPVEEYPRRAGDAAAVVADCRKLRDRLSWSPQHDRLDEIVGHALAWERRQVAIAQAADRSLARYRQSAEQPAEEYS